MPLKISTFFCLFSHGRNIMKCTENKTFKYIKKLKGIINFKSVHVYSITTQPLDSFCLMRLFLSKQLKVLEKCLYIFRFLWWNINVPLVIILQQFWRLKNMLNTFYFTDFSSILSNLVILTKELKAIRFNNRGRCKKK